MPRQTARQVARLAEASYGVSIPYSGARPEDIGWRTVSAVSSRDLPTTLQDMMIVQSFRAYRTNPMAHRLIEMPIGFVLGNGISISSKNKELQALILGWWKNKYNAWHRKMEPRTRDLFIYGEWLHRPLIRTNKADFQMYIRDTKPEALSSVLTDPYDHGEVDQVVFRQIIVGDEVRRDVPAPVIRTRLDPETAEEHDPAGDVFYFGLHRTSDTGRGVGMLFPTLDFIDLYDDILFSRAEKIQMMSQFYFDLTIDGMSESEMDNYLKNETNLPPAPGSVYAHNSSAALQVIAPDLKADDHVEDARLLKSHIISSHGWPGTWFDDPGTAGRAVGSEMSEPAYRQIEMIQGWVRMMLSYEIDYLIFWAQKVGALKEYDKPDDLKYSIIFAKPNARDFQRIGPALDRFGTFLTKITDKFITAEESRELLLSVINQLGIADTELPVELPIELSQYQQEMRQANLERAKGPQQFPGATPDKSGDVSKVGKPSANGARSPGNRE